jgi:hypothetical protein
MVAAGTTFAAAPPVLDLRRPEVDAENPPLNAETRPPFVCTRDRIVLGSNEDRGLGIREGRGRA